MEISLNGTVYKYTNFVFGYQERYFKLHNGTIYYYLSKDSEKYGCRKFKTLANFSLIYDNDDPCRFDVVFRDEKWCLKFRSRDELILWRDALQAFLIEKNSMEKQIRLFSSDNPSTICASECDPNTSKTLTPKIGNSKSIFSRPDLIVLRQLRSDMPEKLNVLMNVLDRTTELIDDNGLRLNSEIDDNETLTDLNLALKNCYQLKRDVICLKNVLKTISLKLIQKQENQQIENDAKKDIKENIEYEKTFKKKEHNLNHASISNNNQMLEITKSISKENIENDSAENSEEWEDAIDNFLPINFIEQTNGLKGFITPSQSKANNDFDGNEDAFYTPEKFVTNNSVEMLLNEEKKIESIAEEGSSIDSERSDFNNLFSIELIAKNKIFTEISRIAWNQLKHALAPVDNGIWELFVKDKEMYLYRMDHEEEDGIVCDPIKAIHSVAGVSAKEYIDIFYDPDLKMEWDDTLVKIKTIEILTDNTSILHQVHKRIWPSAQRESLFWSQRLDVSAHRDSTAIDAFMVCNHDTKRDDVPLNDSSAVRVKLTIAMLCQTVITNNSKTITDSLTRDDICCKITYVSQVHPGGWVPIAALRQIYKREYPKFLRQFSSYVLKRVKSKPLKLNSV